jgi:Protein of unknown function (DUF1566)
VERLPVTGHEEDMTNRTFRLAIVLAAFGSTMAGSLTPPGPPAPTMVTLQQIYDGERPGSDTCFDNVGTNRFVDCGSTGLGTSNGTVKDAQTGLIWLKHASCFGATTWADANIKAAVLASGQCGLTDGSKAGDWRLPTKDEWMAMLRLGCYPSPGGPTIPDRSGNACYAGGTPWATNVQSADYWSSTSNANPTTAWALDLSSGNNSGGAKTLNLYAWPVRAER